MKLYTFDPAPNPRRVSLMLKHKGIDIDSEQVDLMKGEQFADDFIERNPNSKIPTLRDGCGSGNWFTITSEFTVSNLLAISGIRVTPNPAETI